MAIQGDSRAERANELLTQASEALSERDAALALRLVQKAMALRPQQPHAHRLVGQIYQHMGKPLLAKKFLDTADALATKAADPAALASGGAATAAPAPVPAALAASQPQFEIEPVESGDDERFMTMSASEQRAVMDMTMQCLTQMSHIEQLLATHGQGNGSEYDVIHGTREALGHSLQEARTAWRAHQQEAAPAAADAGAGALFTHTLGTMKGAVGEGPEVANLQRLLNQQGYQVAITGNYDRSTALAVSKLQEKHNLATRDGLVGRETRLLLNRLATATASP